MWPGIARNLVLARAARAHASWQGRPAVTLDDVLAVAELALFHRQRDALPPPPPAAPPPPRENPGEDTPEQQTGPSPEPPAQPEQSPAPVQAPEGAENDRPAPPPGDEAEDSLFAIGETYRVKRFAPVEDRLARRGSGRRARSRTREKQGRYVRSRPRTDCRDLAFDATLRAAAPHQRRRRAASHLAMVIRREDWQEKVREKRIGSFVLFVVDASGSMGARGRMVASKGAVMSLLLDAYQKRDKVAMITFRRREAALLLPPTSSIDVAGKMLREMPVGGHAAGGRAGESL